MSPAFASASSRSLVFQGLEQQPLILPRRLEDHSVKLQLLKLPNESSHGGWAVLDSLYFPVGAQDPIETLLGEIHANTNAHGKLSPAQPLTLSDTGSRAEATVPVLRCEMER